MPNVAQVASLLDPAKALTLKFTNDGKMSVLTRVKQPGGSYAETELHPPQATTGAQSFEIGVDSGHSPANAAALLVHADGGWDEGWEDEVAQVMGGAPFPYGRDPIGQKDDFDPKAVKPTSTRGSFLTSDNDKVKVAPKLVVNGFNQTTIAAMPQNIGTKYLSLWLPAGVNGYVKLPAWQGDGTYRSIDNPPPSSATAALAPAAVASKPAKGKRPGQGGE